MIVILVNLPYAHTAFAGRKFLPFPSGTADIDPLFLGYLVIFLPENLEGDTTRFFTCRLTASLSDQQVIVGDTDVRDYGLTTLSMIPSSYILSKKRRVRLSFHPNTFAQWVREITDSPLRHSKV